MFIKSLSFNFTFYVALHITADKSLTHIVFSCLEAWVLKKVFLVSELFVFLAVNLSGQIVSSFQLGFVNVLLVRQVVI